MKVPEKSKIDSLANGFDYLGYQFTNEHISARGGSIEKLKASLAGIFTSYKHFKNKSLKILEWRLNLRITGCVFEKKCKGWQFFFAEINDEKLLHRLDHYVFRLCKRFGVAYLLKHIYNVIHAQQVLFALLLEAYLEFQAPLHRQIP